MKEKKRKTENRSCDSNKMIADVLYRCQKLKKKVDC
jgi:hypothetical protein